MFYSKFYNTNYFFFILNIFYIYIFWSEKETENIVIFLIPRKSILNSIWSSLIMLRSKEIDDSFDYPLDTPYRQNLF